MSADTVKLLFTYIIALVLIVGGMIILYLTRLDPPESNSANISLMLAGFIGAAITFVFNRESATQATRAAQSSAAIASSQPSAADARAERPAVHPAR
jgi:hypothetical protein